MATTRNVEALNDRCDALKTDHGECPAKIKVLIKTLHHIGIAILLTVNWREFWYRIRCISERCVLHTHYSCYLHLPEILHDLQLITRLYLLIDINHIRLKSNTLCSENLNYSSSFVVNIQLCQTNKFFFLHRWSISNTIDQQRLINQSQQRQSSKTIPLLKMPQHTHTHIQYMCSTLSLPDAMCSVSVSNHTNAF